jgi:four helix bundle protein
MDAKELRDRSQKFALDIIKFCDGLPRDCRTQDMAGQLQNAATSASQNYRAACRGRSDAEFIAKICVTVEEADEVEGWLETLIKSGKASGEEARRLLAESTELLKIFAASKRTVMRRVAAEEQPPRRRRRPKNR